MIRSIFTKNIVFLLHCLSIVICCNAQNWEAVDTLTYLDGNPRFLYVDSISDRLYLGGGFEDRLRKFNGALHYYDGHKIHNLDTFRPPPSGDSYSMFRYQNELYVGGYFSEIGKNNVASNFIAKLKNDSFISVNQTPHRFAGATVNSMVEYQGKMIIGYQGDSLAGIKSRGIVSFDGTSFSPMGGGVLDKDPVSRVYDLTVYKNKLYAGGNFYEDKNQKLDQTTRNFQIWDDIKNKWTIVDGWKGGRNSIVNELIEYKNDLYILGGFYAFDGAISNCIVRYDGKYFYQVGHGMKSYQIQNATVHNDNLYVCGFFQEVDGIKAYGIAKWDGVKWCNLSNDIFTRTSNIYGVDDIAFYHDTLYAYGGFQKINGKKIKTIAKWIGDVSRTENCSNSAEQDTVSYNLSISSELEENIQIRVYPNPLGSKLNIEILDFTQPISFNLCHINGQSLIWGNLTSPTSEINLQWLPAGTYFLKIETETGLKVQKIIKR